MEIGVANAAYSREFEKWQQDYAAWERRYGAKMRQAQ